ncbi:uncharacterized protein LOC112169252 [Rosa chinensis]|uniref:uncharacterized protein LOC112169252 n=1 Tax=Rosa chinensis TaxID=74649 RepID=UPI000D0976CC|nr:uncharacterized protein LOC112169252 [Rosa chinensis]
MRKDYEATHFEEQKALQFRLNEVLSLNEAYWRQRSRIQWLREGDHNTSFFHRRASNRRCWNRVKGLVNDLRQWTAQPNEVVDILIDYYDNIFRSEHVDSEALALIIDSMQTKVTDDMNADLLAPYTDSEIKKALFQMHPLKSPSPDGQVAQESNFTHLTLILKIKELKLPSDLRPIALCNVVYKIASKVLAIPLSRRVGIDRATWKLDKRGFFSVKSAYAIACDFSIGNVFASTSLGDPYAQLWNALWKTNVPNKVAIFGWKAAHNLLPTRTALTFKGYSGELNCCVCSESILEHIF